MKRIRNKHLILLTGCFLMLVFFIASSFARAIPLPAAQDELAQAINNDRWDFKAEYAQPASGQSRYISGCYYV